MTEMSPWRSRLPLINSVLLGILFFTIPTHVAPAYMVSALMLVVLLMQGNFRNIPYRNPVLWLMLSYYAIYALGLLWTENMLAGQRMLGKQTFFLLFPIYLAAARPEHIRYYLNAFIISVTLSELLAYYNWLQIYHFPDWPKGISAGKDFVDIGPFVDHILYTPILALGAYLLGHAIFLEKIPVSRRCVFMLFLSTMTANVFISGGRAGQVAYFSLMALLMLQKFSKRPMMALMLAAATVLSLFGVAYLASDTFSSRANLVIHEALNFKTNPNTSVGLRINWAMTSWELFCQHPWLGVGTGDFTDAFAQLAAQIAPSVDTTFNPHNQYLFALTTTGLLGGGALLALLIAPPWLWRKQKQQDSYPHLRIALVFLYLVICFSESYLWRSNTSLMFVAFTAVLYKYSRAGFVHENIRH